MDFTFYIAVNNIIFDPVKVTAEFFFVKVIYNFHYWPSGEDTKYKMSGVEWKFQYLGKNFRF